MKKKLLCFMMVIVLSVLAGCSGFGTTSAPSAEVQQTAATNQIMTEMNNQIGMPNIKEFYEKKMAKEIFELRDNSKLVTYAYFQSMNGKFVFLGQCVGFGLPYSTQYTNPERLGIVKNYSQAGDAPYTLPQADPNGLFTPTGLSATWLMYINPDTGKREVIYSEPSLVVTQSKMPKRLVETWSLPDNY